MTFAEAQRAEVRALNWSIAGTGVRGPTPYFGGGEVMAQERPTGDAAQLARRLQRSQVWIVGL